MLCQASLNAQRIIYDSPVSDRVRILQQVLHPFLMKASALKIAINLISSDQKQERYQIVIQYYRTIGCVTRLSGSKWRIDSPGLEAKRWCDQGS